MFCKKPIVFFGVFVMVFCLNVDYANAKYCNSHSYKVAAGKYCDNLVEASCPAGCYCTGGGNISWVKGDVKKGCSDRWSKISNLSDQGVYLCPSPFTKSDGAISDSSGCYYTNSSGTKLYNKNYTCSAGQYLPANSITCTTCPKNYYCPGVANKPSDSDAGKSACPSGTQSALGAKSSSDCKIQISCSAGTYLPANSKDCTPCRTDSYCDGITNAVPSNKDQGITKCQEGLIPNDDHTGCHEPADTECAAGQYLPAGTTKCQTCPDGYACPGGTSDAIECTSFTSVSDDKTTCVATNVTCDAGYYLPTNLPQCTPCNGATETAGKVCKGGVLTPSETAPAGLESCAGTMVPNKEQTSCVAASTNSVTCNAGYYLPMNSKECTACPERKKCTGGTFEFNATADQGIDAIKEYAITKDMLAFGTGNADSPLKSHCWYIVNPDKYKECISNALKQLIIKDKATEKLVTKNTNTQKQTPSSISATGTPSTLANISDSKIDKSTIDIGSTKTTVTLGGKATGINLKF